MMDSVLVLAISGKPLRGARSLIWRILIGFGLLVAQPAPASDRVALLVGNSAYLLDSLQLPNPKNDADALVAPLRRLGFDVDVLLDANREEMEKAVDKFAGRAKGAEIALFFYAGHATQLSSTNYLLGTSLPEVSHDAAIAHALNTFRVRDALRRANPRLAVVVLDACRDNPFTSEQTGSPALADSGLARQTGETGVLISYATDPGNVAFDGQGVNSFFTAALLKHIETPGLEVRLMFGRVRQEVVATTRGIQVPWVEESVIGTHYLHPAPVIKEDRFAAEIALWQEALRAGDAERIEEYRRQYPDGVFSSLVPVAIQRLNSSQPTVKPVVNLDRIVSNDTQRVRNALSVIGTYNEKKQNDPNNTLKAAVERYLFQYRRDRFDIDQLTTDAGRAALSIGAALGREIATDLVRLRGIDRAIDDVALPAFQRLEKKLAHRKDAANILAKPREQLASMQAMRERFLQRLDQTRGLYFNLLQKSRTLDLLTAAGGRSLNPDARQTNRPELLERYASLFRRHAQEQSAAASQGTYRWLADFLP